MTQDENIRMFKQGYNQYSWKKFLGETFPNARLFPIPKKITDIDTNMATEALKLGNILLNENGIERLISVYEVTLAKGIILERNRVGLRNLLRKYWKNIDAAFIVYHNKENNKWRFSYISELTGYDASGNFKTIVTEPKRCTYVLGEGESIRTAAERFSILSKKADNITLDDVKETFSVEKLSKAFFDEYKKHYQIFCDYMMKSPNIRATIFNGDDKAIRDFNKKLLGRIVFLYFIQKKGWLGVPIENKWGSGDLNFLSNIFKQYEYPDLFYRDILTRLFFDTLNTKRDNDIIELINGHKYKIPYLNGGLFEEDDPKQRNIIIDGKLFQNLFNFFDQYNFTIYEDDPNDQTVAVDPEMLGHIFENLLEDNKDKGAFYTPKNIVHYMCQESIIEYLSNWFENKGYDVINYISFDNTIQPKLFSENETRVGQLIFETPIQNNNKKIDRSLIEKFLNKNLSDDDKKLILKHSEEFNKALDSVKICDPAIGSGAFPMGLLQEIFTAKQTLWHYQYGNLKNFPASDIKLNIIQNSIYGVDIEKGAVDIARLRFWLSLVIDEDVPKPLPNLDYKIVIGNSLVSKIDDTDIDIDWEMDVSKYGAFANDTAINIKNILKKIVNEQKEYFKTNCDKNKLSLDIRRIKIELLINQLKLMIIVKETIEKNKYNKENIVQKNEIKLKILEWEKTIKKLEKLIEQPDEPLNFFDWKLDFPDILNKAINPNPGFDIVIGNPPYVSTKGVSEKDKKVLQQKFGFADDLYNHFYFKGIQLLKEKGTLAYISSKTFWTIQTKKNLRELILKNKLLQLVDTANPFESAMVDTCITILQKETASDYEIKFIDIYNGWNYKKEYIVNKCIYKNIVNNVFFEPNELNMKIYEKIAQKIKPLIDIWWDKISTSKNIEKYKTELEKYRQSLKPGDITLLGLITEGGQGLATANNGKYIGVLEGTKWADKVRQDRIKKLSEFIQTNKPKELPQLESKADVQDFLNQKSEIEIRKLFDDLKKKYGRDIFGQGWLYRIVNANEIADVEKLTDDEKLNGIKGNKTFVPYDKGDKDGNRWWAPTPYYIDWSRENVMFLKENSGKKGEGMPVVRNPQFYFREGFCWTNVLNPNARLIKTKLKDRSINDVGSMSLYVIVSFLNTKFIICILNSNLLFDYYRTFINYSVNIQINDIRQLPIVIPTPGQLKEFERIFDRAKRVQEEKFSGKISEKEAEEKLEKIQIELDEKVLELYGLE